MLSQFTFSGLYVGGEESETNMRKSVNEHAGLRIRTNHKLMKPDLVGMLNGEV